MANISLLSRLVNGVQRQVDLSTNTLVVGSLQITASGNILTNTILGNLINLQNGTDFSTGTNAHTHDGRYFTKTQLGSISGGTAGSTLIGDDNSYTNFSNAAGTVKGALSAIDTVLGTVTSNNSFDDSLFNIFNHTTASKKIAFSAAGISAATTRTITMPDANVNLGLVLTAIQANGSVAFTADQSMGGHLLTNLATPVSGTDAANKNYVDNIAQGLNWKNVVRTATTAALPAYTYTAGVITATANGALTAQDGVTLVATDRLLVKNETSTNAPFNGIYTVTQVGDVTHPYILTRALDVDTATELTAATVEVSPSATTQAGYIFRESNTITTIGTDNVSFIIVSHGLDWVFGNGLSVSGNNVTVLASDASILVASGGISVQLATGSALTTGGSGITVNVLSTGGIQITTNALALKLADNSLQTTSSGASVKLDPAGAIIVGTPGIKVQTDGATVGINGSNQVAVPNAGITNVQINTNVFDQSTITGGAGTPAAVAFAPAIMRSVVAGQSFAANVTLALRWGQPSQSETANRVYAADLSTSTTDRFHVIGLFNSGSAITAGQTITMVVSGPITLGTSDTTFGSGDQGYPVWLGASGAYTANAALALTSGQAAFKLGIAESATVIWVDRQMMGVN